jgi:ribosomal protein S12 methylthiotransferase
VLARMNRRMTQERLRKTIETLRGEIPQIALRTSVIVGFPGETDAAFENLLSFIREIRFERLGAFRYSNEDGAAAFRYPDQVPEALKQERFDRLMQLQQELASQFNQRWLGKTCEVLIDEPDPSDPAIFLGRTSADCPEVDGIVYVKSHRPLAPGEFAQVRIVDTYEYDLVARLIDD